jgi:lipoprotein-releasing system permease protein
MTNFSWRIARRYLWARRGEAFITLIGIISFLAVALSVAVLILVMSIMGGFETTLREKILGTNAHIVVRSFTDRIAAIEELRQVSAARPEVESVSLFTYDQALLRIDRQVSGVLVRGIESNSQTYESLRSFVEVYEGVSRDGALFSPIVGLGTDADVTLPGIVIGKELARNMALSPGSIISLMSPEFESSPFGLSPRFRRFVVTGIYSSGLVEYESGLVYLSLPDAQAFFRYGDAVAGAELRVINPTQSPKVAAELQTSLRELRPDYYTIDWTESNRALWEALALEKQVYFLVLLLLVVLASFSIVSGLVMLVLEKRKDIAILRTLGANAGQVARIFTLQGAVIGGLGTLTGVVLGVVGAMLLDAYGFPLPEGIFPVDTVPVRIHLGEALVVAVVSFLICLISTLYPARRARLLQPAEVLRYE